MWSMIVTGIFGVHGDGYLLGYVLPETIKEILPKVGCLAPLASQPDEEHPHVEAFQVEAGRKVFLQAAVLEELRQQIRTGTGTHTHTHMHAHAHTTHAHAHTKTQGKREREGDKGVRGRRWRARMWKGR